MPVHPVCPPPHSLTHSPVHTVLCTLCSKTRDLLNADHMLGSVSPAQPSLVERRGEGRFGPTHARTPTHATPGPSNEAVYLECLSVGPHLSLSPSLPTVARVEPGNLRWELGREKGDNSNNNNNKNNKRSQSGGLCLSFYLFDSLDP